MKSDFESEWALCSAKRYGTNLLVVINVFIRHSNSQHKLCIFKYAHRILNCQRKFQLSTFNYFLKMKYIVNVIAHMQVCKRIYQREVQMRRGRIWYGDNCEVSTLGALRTFESGGSVNDNNDSPCKQRTKPRRGDSQGKASNRKKKVS